MYSQACVKNSVHWGEGRGCPGPGPGGVCPRWDVQAQALGGGSAQVGCPGPEGGVCPGGVGVSRPRPVGMCIPTCTEADPPNQMATAADGRHPTGMHFLLNLLMGFLDITVFLRAFLWNPVKIL